MNIEEYKNEKHVKLVLSCPWPSDIIAAEKAGFDVEVLWHQVEKASSDWSHLLACSQLAKKFTAIDYYHPEDLKRKIQQIVKESPSCILLHDGNDKLLSPFLLASEGTDRLLNSPEVYKKFLNKAEIRKAIVQNPKLAIKARQILSLEDLRDVLNSWPYPYIIKPGHSAWSQNVYRIDSQNMSEFIYSFWEKRQPFSLVAEEYLEGTQFSVESISIQGRHYFLGVTEKFPVLPPHFVEMGGVFPARIDTALQAEMYSVVSDLFNTIGYENGPGHTEIIVTDSGPKIVETHARFGGLIEYLYFSATKQQMYEILFNALRAQSAPVLPSYRDVAVLRILELPIGQRLAAFSGLDEVLKDPSVAFAKISVKLGDIIQPLRSNFDRCGMVVVSGADFKEALQRADQALQRLNIQLEEVEHT